MADPWQRWPLGARVTVRRRLLEGGYSDVVGVLVERADSILVLRTRQGELVTVRTAEIAVGRVVPDAAPRRR